MRLLVCGTRSFGAAVVNTLANVGPWEVAGVVAPPGDRTANEARALGLPVGETVNEAWCRSMKVDLIVAAHSHAFIGARTRAATRFGAIGYHPSLLPRHRGRDAVRWTIKMGDPIAGGSVYWLTDNVDGGPIAWQEWCHVVPGWTHHDLWRERLFTFGVQGLLQVVRDIDSGVAHADPQDERCATWEPSWEREPVWRPELPELGSNGLTLLRTENRVDQDINGRAAI